MLISLVYPRWLYDGREALYQPWRMTFNPDLPPEIPEAAEFTDNLPDNEADRFRGGGRKLATENLVGIADDHAKLKGQDVEEYAVAVDRMRNMLNQRQQAITFSFSHLTSLMNNSKAFETCFNLFPLYCSLRKCGL